MSKTEWELLIAHAAPTIAALAALIASLKNRARIKDVHMTINSRMDELLRVARAESHAEGVKEERQRRGSK